MLGLLVVQFMLGLTAFFVLLDEVGMVQPSNLQVASNTSHMVIGALLMASSVALLTWSLRERHRFAPGASPVSPKPVPQPA